MPKGSVVPVKCDLPVKCAVPVKCATPVRRLTPTLLALAISLAWTAGCSDGRSRSAGSGEAAGGSPGSGEPAATNAGALLVMAASDLQFAFEEMVALYESQTGERVRVVLGSTGNLAAQIRHGAPADLFFAANEVFLADLIEAGHVSAESRRAYAIGRLALVSPPGMPPPPGLSELTNPRYEVVAIANPDHAPYGMAARETLQTMELWESLNPRLVLGENIAHAMQFVRTGNADAGIVALGLVLGGGESYPHTLVDAGLHAPLRQSAGVVTGSGRDERAARFLEFVISDLGREVLTRYGFEDPEGSPEGRGFEEGSGSGRPGALGDGY